VRGLLIALAKAAVTLALFYFLFRKLDLAGFMAGIREARLSLILFAFSCLWTGHYICIFRWRMLMRPLMPVLSVGRLFAIYCVGLFFNLAFPTLVGGDAVKLYYAGKPSKRYVESFAASFLDRDAGMLGMMIIACSATLVHPVTLAGVPVILIVWAVFAAFIALNVAIFLPALHACMTGLMRRCGLARAATKIDSVSEAFVKMSREPGALAGAVAISLLNQFIVISVVWITSTALGLSIGLGHFLVIVPTVTLISMVPVSLSGMGLREFAMVSLLAGLGAGRESAAALGLLCSGFVIVSAIPGGIIYLFLRGREDSSEMAALESQLQ
jgi:glycosyltransferase 2 family protein